MNLLSQASTYWKFATACAQCERCTHACPSLSAAGMTMGSLARTLNTYGEAADSPETLRAWIKSSKEINQAVRGCFFCTECENACLAGNDICELIYAARVDFQKLNLIPRWAWNSVLVDEEWDIFTAYRAIYGIWYNDLTRHIAEVDAEGVEVTPAATDCAVAFFPGCSLAAYAPELTREVFDTVEKLGGKTTLIDHCCGSPLKSAGFADRADALLDRIVDEIVSSGASTVVGVCPGCCNGLASAVARRGVDVQVVSLAAFLLDHGYVNPKAEEVPQMALRVSRSCQDRDGSYYQDACEVVGLDASVPAIFKGCCGAGGAVGTFSQERKDGQIRMKLSYVQDGETVVTLCPTCTYTYAFYLADNPRDIGNKHYLELMFDNGFNWPVVSEQLNSMWTGEYGPWLSSIFN